MYKTFYSLHIVILLHTFHILLPGLRKSKGDPENELLSSLHLAMCTSWLSMAVTAISLHFGHTSAINALLPVFSFSVLATILYLIFGLISQCNFLALVSFLWSCCWALEITNLYTSDEYRLSTAALYTVLAVVTLYLGLRSALAKIKLTSRGYRVAGVQPKTPSTSSPLLLVVYFCQLMPLIPALFTLTKSNLITVEGFAIPSAVAGVVCLVCWVSILRHNEKYYALATFLYGSLWLPSGLSLVVTHGEGVQRASLCAILASFLILILLSSKQSIFHILFNFTYFVLILALTIQGFTGHFFLVMCWLMILCTLYVIIHYGCLISTDQYKVPIGNYDKIAREISKCFEKIKSCCRRQAYELIDPVSVQTDILGFSKYADVEMTGFLANAISALSLLGLSPGNCVMALAWILPIGCVLQFIIGCVCLSRGRSLESSSFILFSMFWAVWGSVWGLQLIRLNQVNFQSALGHTGFLLVGLVLCCLSIVISKAWFLYSIALLVNPVLAIVYYSGVVPPSALNIALTVIFCLVCLYCSFAYSSPGVFGRAIVPIGQPIVRVVYGGNESTVIAPSRKASGTSQIAGKSPKHVFTSIHHCSLHMIFIIIVYFLE